MTTPQPLAGEQPVAWMLTYMGEPHSLYRTEKEANFAAIPDPPEKVVFPLYTRPAVGPASPPSSLLQQAVEALEASKTYGAMVVSDPWAAAEIKQQIDATLTALRAHMKGRP